MSMEIKELLLIAEKRLSDAGCQDAKIDSELLLCDLLHYDKKDIFMNWAKVLDDKPCEAYFHLIDERAAGKPIQYMLGEQEFMGISFHVDERVLIPRQDTETLVEEALEYLQSMRAPSGGWKVLDLCTGSGAIAISICKNMKDVSVTASDISEGAIEVAKQNAANAGVGRRIKFVKSDLFEGFKEGITGPSFHLIVSNPPYIPSEVLPTLQKEIYEHEPLLALDGGMDGLDVYRKIVDKAHAFIKKKGMLLLEIGHDQANDVKELIGSAKRYLAPDVVKDLAGRDRVIRVQIKDKNRK